MAWAIAAIIALLALLANETPSPADDIPDSIPDDASDGPDIPAPGDLSQGVSVDAISKFVLGIWKSEGMGPNDRAQRNNNPGNLKFAGQQGATEGEGGFAVFGTWQQGFSAAVRQVQLDATRNPDWTILQEMRKWLGMDPNGALNVTTQGNALTKAQTVAATVGVKSTDTLRNVLGV